MIASGPHAGQPVLVARPRESASRRMDVTDRDLPGDSLREHRPADHRVDLRQNREDALNVPIHQLNLYFAMYWSRKASPLAPSLFTRSPHMISKPVEASL